MLREYLKLKKNFLCKNKISRCNYILSFHPILYKDPNTTSSKILTRNKQIAETKERLCLYPGVLEFIHFLNYPAQRDTDDDLTEKCNIILKCHQDRSSSFKMQKLKKPQKPVENNVIN